MCSVINVCCVGSETCDSPAFSERPRSSACPMFYTSSVELDWMLCRTRCSCCWCYNANGSTKQIREGLCFSACRFAYTCGEVGETAHNHASTYLPLNYYVHIVLRYWTSEFVLFVLILQQNLLWALSALHVSIGWATILATLYTLQLLWVFARRLSK